MLLPVVHVFLDQSLVESDDSLEQANGLLTVVDLGGRELIDGGVVGLELASLEERYGVLDERHGRQLGQVLVIVQALLARLDAAFEFDYAPLDLILGHENGADHELVVLQVVELFEVVDSLRVARAPPFFQLMSLLYGLKNCIKLQNLVLEPHFDVNKRVGQRLRQIIKIFLELRVLRILEEKLFFWQLILFRQVLLTAEIHVDFRAIGKDRVQLVVVQELV